MSIINVVETKKQQIQVNEDVLETNYHKIIESIGENPQRDGLLGTAKRAAKAMTYLTNGYREDIEKTINGAIFPTQNNEMVLVKDIELYSLCEHHLLPFIGKCHVAYIPNGKVIGLSKIARIVDIYSRRLQIQENLTKEIADTINEVLSPCGVAVVIESKHMCMMMRGVQKQNSFMHTSYLLGRFKESAQESEKFFNMVK